MSMNIDEMLKEAPTLTLEMPGTKEMPAAVTQGTVSQSAAPQEASEDAPQIVLTEEEQKLVDSFAKQIDITSTQQVTKHRQVTRGRDDQHFTDTGKHKRR